MAVVHHENEVGILHGRDALGDDDLRRLGDIGAEALADQRVGARVDRGGRVVEDQNLRLFEKRPGDAETLLLSAGDVRAALLDIGVIPVGEGADEFVRLREPARLDHLVVGGVFVAPAQVILDRAGKQHILLQHDADRAAQRLKVVFAHISAADLDAALAHIVKARDELHEGRLARARTAEDADGHARVDVQVDVLQREFLRLCGVLEADVFKVDGAVLHVHRGRCGIGERGLFLEYLADTDEGLIRHRHHHVDHRDHHQRH